MKKADKLESCIDLINANQYFELEVENAIWDNIDNLENNQDTDLKVAIVNINGMIFNLNKMLNIIEDIK